MCPCAQDSSVNNCCDVLNKVSVQKLALSFIHCCPARPGQFSSHSTLVKLCFFQTSANHVQIKQPLTLYLFEALFPTQTSATNLDSLKYGSGQEEEKLRWQTSLKIMLKINVIRLVSNKECLQS